MKRKLLSILLCLCIVERMLPAGRTLASDSDTVYTTDDDLRYIIKGDVVFIEGCNSGTERISNVHK